MAQIPLRLSDALRLRAAASSVKHADVHGPSGQVEADVESAWGGIESTSWSPWVGGLIPDRGAEVHAANGMTVGRASATWPREPGAAHGRSAVQRCCDDEARTHYHNRWPALARGDRPLPAAETTSRFARSLHAAGFARSLLSGDYIFYTDVGGQKIGQGSEIDLGRLVAEVLIVVSLIGIGLVALQKCRGTRAAADALADRPRD